MEKLSVPTFLNPRAAESAGLSCRVRASVVCRYWKQIEASNPLQLAELSWGSYWQKRASTDPHFLSLKWHLRNTRSLIKLSLDNKAIPLFLEMRLELPQLQSLSICDWNYTYKDANLLVEIQQLRNLKVD